MQHFGTTEVSRLADIPIRSVRAMVRARYVIPSRGPRGIFRFSFQDVVLLRTARQLLAARISPRRVGAALRSIREQLPAELPPTGLSVTAAGDRVVVHEAGGKRDAVSGQLLLALEVRVDGGRLELIDNLQASAGSGKADASRDFSAQFEAALALEDTDIDAALDAYRACVAAHAHQGALANLGRLLHLRGRITEAVTLYLSADAPDGDVLYNLAVALEDLGRRQEAIDAYVSALAQDTQHADAHHNLARLYQESGDQRRALRHWNAYRRLSRGSAD